MKILLTKTQQILKQDIPFFVFWVFVLFVAWGLSLFASYHWFFDLFSHFAVQYFIGGMGLCVILLCLKRWRFALLALLIGFASFTEISGSRFIGAEQDKKIAKANSSFSVLHLNHYLQKENFADFEAYLRGLDNKPIVISLQEANADTVAFAKRVKDLYPYQIYEDRSHAFGMVVLSQNPMVVNESVQSRYQTFPLPGPVMENFLLKTDIKTDDNQIISYYALHTLPPMRKAGFDQRNSELKQAAQIIAANPNPLKIVAGDWNITPYSPFFKTFVGEAGLNYQSDQMFLEPSWPSFLMINVLQIPIDQIIYSNAFVQKEKKIGPAFGSDHHSLLGVYGYSGLR